MCTVPWSHMTMKWMTGLLLRGCCAPLLCAEASTQVNIILQLGLQSRGDQERCGGRVDGSGMEEVPRVRAARATLVLCGNPVTSGSKLLNPTTQCPRTVILYSIRLNFNLRCCWIW